MSIRRKQMTPSVPLPPSVPRGRGELDFLIHVWGLLNNVLSRRAGGRPADVGVHVDRSSSASAVRLPTTRSAQSVYRPTFFRSTSFSSRDRSAAAERPSPD